MKHKYENSDFSTDGHIMFGKFAGRKISELPEDYVNGLIGHYTKNIAILKKFRNKQKGEDSSTGTKIPS